MRLLPLFLLGHSSPWLLFQSLQLALPARSSTSLPSRSLQLSLLLRRCPCNSFDLLIAHSSTSLPLRSFQLWPHVQVFRSLVYRKTPQMPATAPRAIASLSLSSMSASALQERASQLDQEFSAAFGGLAETVSDEFTNMVNAQDENDFQNSEFSGDKILRREVLNLVVDSFPEEEDEKLISVCFLIYSGC